MPIDVLWFRLPRADSAPETLGYIGSGQIVIAINRGGYWQCGTIIDKGSFERTQAEGLPAFRSRVAAAAPFLATSLNSLTDWDQVKPLSVRANRLRQWWLPGLLCIGDAAHAMSPVGGIGVNYAIADAVAAANSLAGLLLDGRVSDDDLRAVQKRRQTPTKVAQLLQGAQTANLARLSKTDPPLWMFRLLNHSEPVKRLLGRMVGLGFRREHIHTADQQGGLPAPSSRVVDWTRILPRRDGQAAGFQYSIPPSDGAEFSVANSGPMPLLCRNGHS
jgi:2-polyprenyl-6-methoxyphenol hydroxylase-like FAD-dependent oxidoreductase